MSLVGIAEQGWIPDFLLRAGIRRRLADRLRREETGTESERRERAERLRAELLASPIAVHTDLAKQQHYELPAAFFEAVLGRRLKYSSAYWPEGVHSLDEAEEAMLELYAERAELLDGMEILDLGCGWGSLSLWLCERYPGARVTALSNSLGQANFIRGRAEARGLQNLQVITSDINQLKLRGSYDRILSIEMFEHMRNYQMLLRMLRSALKNDGKLFVHIFTHHRYAYFFEAEGPGDWMARHFFTGGIMPSEDLLSWFQDDLRLVQRWSVSGRHYGRTANAWLSNIDRNRKRVDPILSEVYGSEKLTRWRSRWRLFFIACAELFDYHDGEEWKVSHYLFEPR